MNGTDVYTDVCTFLGNDGNAQDTEIQNSAVMCINRILSDLGLAARIDTLCDNLEVPDSAANALVYGTAMLVSAIRLDGDRQRYFTELYNPLRAAFKSTTATVRDVLPRETQ